MRATATTPALWIRLTFCRPRFRSTTLGLFAITIAISVLISAFVALSLTPALCTRLLKPHAENHDQQPEGFINKVFKKFNDWFARVTDKYGNGVQSAIKYSRFVVILLICIVVGAGLLFRSKPSGFLPTENEGRIIITFNLPEGTSTGRTVAVLEGMMDELKHTKGIAHYAALGGLNAVNFSSNSNPGTIFCQLEPWEDRKDAALQLNGLMASVQKNMARFQEATTVVISPPAIPGLGNTGGLSFIF